MGGRRPGRGLTCGLLAVTAVAVAVRVPLLGTTYLAPDSSWYLTVAGEIFHGRGYVSQLRPPAYTTLLAVLELFGASPGAAVVVLQTFIGIALAALVLLVGWRLFSPFVGIVGGFLAAASPLMLVTEQFVLTDFLFSVLLFVATALLAEAALRLPGGRRAWPVLVAAGATFGLATLFRVNGLYALVAMPIVLVIAGPRWKPSLRASAIAVAAIAAVLAPWCVHNLIRFGNANVATEGGLSLYSRAISYDQVQPSTDNRYGRLAREIYNAADPNGQEAAVGTTARVLEAFVLDLGLEPTMAMARMGDLAREAILDDPGTYVKDTVQILGRFQGVYYPRTFTGRPHADQIALATGYLETLDMGHQSVSGSPFVRFPWHVAQALTQLLFILTAGGLLTLVLPFAGDRRSRVAATSFLVVGVLGIVVVALTARYELRHAVVFAPFIWVLAPAAVQGAAAVVVATVRRGRLRASRVSA